MSQSELDNYGYLSGTGSDSGVLNTNLFKRTSTGTWPNTIGGSTWPSTSSTSTGGFYGFNSPISSTNSSVNGVSSVVDAVHRLGSNNKQSFLGGLFKNGDGSWDYSSIGNTALGLGQLGLGLWSGIMSKDALNNAKELQQFQINAYNRNLANTAKTINNAYDNAARANAGIAGHTDYSSDLERANGQHVDGSEITSSKSSSNNKYSGM